MATDRMNSSKRRKPEDNISPDTLRAEALRKYVDTCAHCNKRCTNSGKNSEAIQCDLCLSWVHAACEGISKSYFKSLNEVLSANSDNIVYLCKVNQCNLHLKQLLASKVYMHQQSEVVNLSSKVDDLNTHSAKLEKELKELNLSIKNLNNSTNKRIDASNRTVAPATLN